MSTPCNIGIINNDNSIDLIYCHWDGYPSYQTPILLNNYNTEEKVRELINLGDISMLGDNVSPTTDTHSFNNPEPNVVVAYHRDRNDDWNESKPRHFTSKASLLKSAHNSYIYLFDSKKNVWTYTSNERFRTFTKPINK